MKSIFSMMTISTWLTIARIVLAPVVMHAVYVHAWGMAAIVFACAAATDFLDGYCARLFKQETQLGKILDPIADKILIMCTVYAVYAIHDGRVQIPLWFIVLIIAKDFLLLLGGWYLLVLKKSMVFNPSVLSKWTTAFLMIFLVYLMALAYGLVTIDCVDACIVGCAVSNVCIVIDYGYQFYQRLAKVKIYEK